MQQPLPLRVTLLPRQQRMPQHQRPPQRQRRNRVISM
jgi:hypothetical protein